MEVKAARWEELILESLRGCTFHNSEKVAMAILE
jgi:hypothetical protein